MSYLSDLLGTAYKEGMTEEEISDALASINDNHDAEITKLKGQLSKANSEAATFKKQLRSKQSDEEAKASQIEADMAALRAENEKLTKSIALGEYKTQLMGQGYDEKLATSTAEAMVDGNMAVIMANQATYLEAQKKKMTADAMRNTPRPGTGSDDGEKLVDYSAKIADAQARGSIAEAAYYTRLQAQENQKS